jgi:hypothetical protein
MRRLLPPAVVLLALLVPAPARAVELGDPNRTERASCPERCQALGRVSGYQLKLEGRTSPFRVDRDGRITAFTLTLGRPTASQQRFFTQSFGGPPSARLAILRRGPKRAHRLVAQSPVVDLTRHLGATRRFPLRRALPVREGYMVAITVPTWAPAFAVGLSREEGWRSSRTVGRCSDVRQRAAQQRIGGLRTYGCFYRTARILYTATFEPDADSPSSRDRDDDRSADEDRDSEDDRNRSDDGSAAAPRRRATGR